ncbi:uncharacterized protein DNG_08396 [Cephalotrichum gorgonifer]|uniref:Lytic polysaccharide monooxygenase n=1 Tax=Cephalotrichum gorgonifer TaxID=2041049 RepID=A0AAE8N510_9PEZI|nr:uncharacterized protein DNG_08396 [Cephalotrichum gorgonifer]
MKPSLILAALGAAGSVMAHMDMSNPPALRHKNNPNNGGDIDNNLIAPVTADNFPCHGSLDLLGTAEGAPVAEYKAGESYSATISGGATHGGGSCQFSLSYDKGKTWTVIQSIVGGCPMSDGQTFDFTIPADAPSSDAAIFSWSWLNRIGNREFYHNCAVVSISGGSSKARRAGGVAFADRPEMFVANIVEGCKTDEGADVAYPDPGPDVVVNSQDAKPPVGGGCGTAVPGNGGNGGNGGGAGGSPGSGDGSGNGGGGGDDGQYNPPGNEGGGGNDGQYTPPAATSSAAAAPVPSAPAPSGPASSGAAGSDDGQYTPPAATSSGAGAPTPSGPAESSDAGGSDGQYTEPGATPSAPSATQSAPGSPVPSSPAASGGAGGGDDQYTEPVATSSAPSAPVPSGPAESSTADDGSEPEETYSEGPAPSASVSLPGGVFVTSEPTSVPASVVPTTLVTSVAPPSETYGPGNGATPDEGTNPSNGTIPDVGTTPDEGASPGDTTPGSGASGQKSGACTEEGAWNCIGGNQFQRCASGQWSPVMAMAAGTSCKAGVSDTLYAVRRRKLRFRRN